MTIEELVKKPRGKKKKRRKTKSVCCGLQRKRTWFVKCQRGKRERERERERERDGRIDTSLHGKERAEDGTRQTRVPFPPSCLRFPS